MTDTTARECPVCAGTLRQTAMHEDGSLAWACPGCGYEEAAEEGVRE